MDGKTIFSFLRCCGYILDIHKVYNIWIRTEESLIGFYGFVGENGDKQKKLERIQEWCMERGLPLKIINDVGFRFKMKIIK